MGLFGKLFLFQSFFQFDDFIAEIVLLSHLLLDRPHLFVEVVVLLGLFHLLLDPSFDLLLNLQDLDLREHQFIDRFHSLGNVADLEDLLLVFQFGVDLRNDDIGKLRGVFDGGDGPDHLQMNLLGHLGIGFKRLPDAPHQGFDFDIFRIADLFEFFGTDQEIFLAGKVFADNPPFFPFNQNLDRTIGQAQQLDDNPDRPDAVDLIFSRIILLGALLRNHEDLFLVLHGGLQRGDRSFPSHEQRNNHMRENHHIPEGQKGNIHRYRTPSPRIFHCQTSFHLPVSLKSSGLRFLFEKEDRLFLVHHDLLADDAFLHVRRGRQFVHDIEHRIFQNRAQTSSHPISVRRTGLQWREARRR